MPSYRNVAFALLAGAGLGAIGVHALHAQAKPPAPRGPRIPLRSTQATSEPLPRLARPKPEESRAEGALRASALEVWP
jgi:hypothetical protein